MDFLHMFFLPFQLPQSHRGQCKDCTPKEAATLKARTETIFFPSRAFMQNLLGHAVPTLSP